MMLCPMSSSTTSFAVGIALTVASAFGNGTTRSALPCNTSVGHRISFSRSMRDVWRSSAAAWRKPPSMYVERSYMRPCSSSTAASSQCFSGMKHLRAISRRHTMNASRESSLGFSAIASLIFSDGSGFAMPGDEKTDVSVSVRSGYVAATSCAIMPPIDWPTMCALPILSASSRPMQSAAMSSSVYAGFGAQQFGRHSRLHTDGTPASSSLVDCPMSRLSNRTTKNPREASASQKASCQRIICALRPMMRRTHGFVESPNVS
mmetsp:Transcript_39898/g.123285  ORF Transcript_39898/g.123285 Transcript_39898/m.123285 type:complete len:262 (-) Transcript_39898:94-879(-)